MQESCNYHCARELPEVTQSISFRQNSQRSPRYLTDKPHSPTSNYSQSLKILLARAFGLEPRAFRHGFLYRISPLMLLISADVDHKDAIKLTLMEQCLNALKIPLRRDHVGTTASAQNHHTEEHLLSQAVAEIIQSTCRKNKSLCCSLSYWALRKVKSCSSLF